MNKQTLLYDKYSKKWQWIFVSIAVLALLTVAALVLIPYGLEWVSESWILRQNIESAEIEDVDFNPFTGRLIFRDIRIKKNGVDEFILGKATLDFDWWPLWKRRLQLRALSLSEATIPVTRHQDGSWSVGSFAFPIKEPKGQGSEKEPWGFGLLAVDLREIRILYRDPNLHKELTVVRSRVTPAVSWSPEEVSRFELLIKADQGSIEVDGSAKPFSKKPSVVANITVKEFSLDWLTPLLEKTGVKSFSGILDSKVELEAALQKHEKVGDVKVSGSLTVRKLATQLDIMSTSLQVHQQNLSLHGSFAYGKDDQWGGNLDAVAEGVKINSLRKGLNVLILERMKLKKVTIDGKNWIRITEAEMDGGNFLERTPQARNGEVPSHAVSLKKVIFKELNIRDLTRTEIDRVSLHGMDGWFARDIDGKVELLKWFGDDVSSKRRGRQDKKGTSVAVRIANVDIMRDSRIVIQDRSVQPPFMLALNAFEAQSGLLDTENPSGKSPVELKAKIGKYSSLRVSGSIQPFGEKPDMDLQGRLESIDLQELTPYSAQRLGYRPKSGHLDAEIKWHVEGGIVDARVSLLVSKLIVERVEDKDDLFARLYDIPLMKALSMLRDRNDNIQLQVTLQGDLRDPQFRLHEVVRKAMGKAIREGAISYYAPLGVTLLTGVALPPGTAYIGKKLIKWAMTLRFKPIHFAPMEQELNAENKAYLDQVALLLRERPNVRIVLCGMATLADLRKLRNKSADEASVKEKEPKDAKPDEKIEPVDEKIVSEETERLLKLAEQRAHTAKDYLVEKGGIRAKRLFMCSPEMEKSDKAPPRVEIGI